MSFLHHQQGRLIELKEMLKGALSTPTANVLHLLLERSQRGSTSLEFSVRNHDASLLDILLNCLSLVVFFVISGSILVIVLGKSSPHYLSSYWGRIPAKNTDVDVDDQVQTQLDGRTGDMDSES